MAAREKQSGVYHRKKDLSTVIKVLYAEPLVETRR